MGSDVRDCVPGQMLQIEKDVFVIGKQVTALVGNVQKIMHYNMMINRYAMQITGVRK